MALATSYAAYFGGTWPIESDVRLGITYTDGVTLFTGTAVFGVLPSPPGFSTLFGVAYDEDGNPEEGVIMSARIFQPPANVKESVYDAKIRTFTTLADGVWSFDNCPQGSVYQVKRGDCAKWTTVTIDNDTTTPMPDFIGIDPEPLAP